jgi:hypothetical protein
MKDIRKQALGKENRRRPAPAGKGILRKRLRQKIYKDCISRYSDKQRNIGISHIRILHQVKITDRTMFIL